jgi:hypothetical protein
MIPINNLPLKRLGENNLITKVDYWSATNDSSFIVIVGLLDSDKICMMTTRLACNGAIESSYWRMDNNSDVGLLMGYVLYRLPIELGSMDLDTFSH